MKKICRYDLCFSIHNLIIHLLKKNAKFFSGILKLFVFIVILPMGKDLARVKVRKKRTLKCNGGYFQNAYILEVIKKVYI